jgi:branched-chain amino acid transport system permease protein
MGAFILSSFLAGIAGALFASYTRYIVPDYWGLVLSIQFVAAIIVGGLASVWGSILGAAFVFALPRIIDQFSLLPPSSSANSLSSGDLNALIYGALIIAFLLFEPGGVIVLVHRSLALLRKLNPHKGEGGEPVEVIDLSESDPNTQVNAHDSSSSTGGSA